MTRASKAQTRRRDYLLLGVSDGVTARRGDRKKARGKPIAQKCVFNSIWGVVKSKSENFTLSTN
ncbi:hypothetical protein [Nostoc sp.]|uniref:hypothetical protein n=1 Tax=Nostoc sp. TaxID=1180 RepID=UPI002FF6714B